MRGHRAAAGSRRACRCHTFTFAIGLVDTIVIPATASAASGAAHHLGPACGGILAAIATLAAVLACIAGVPTLDRELALTLAPAPALAASASALAASANFAGGCGDGRSSAQPAHRWQ